MTDFENASHNAFQKMFPEAKLHCCLFHFGQSLFRHIIQIGLKQIYRSNPDFAWHMKFFIALAFVPESKVYDAYDAILNEPFFTYDENKIYNTEIHNFIDYFEATYIGRPLGTQGARRKPLFSVEKWNVHSLVINGIRNSDY